MGEPDSELREIEQIPFLYEGGIDAYLENEVHPYAKDAWFDMKTLKTGYELSFLKYFYHATSMRTIDEIINELELIERETDGQLSRIVGGLKA